MDSHPRHRRRLAKGFHSGLSNATGSLVYHRRHHTCAHQHLGIFLCVHRESFPAIHSMVEEGTETLYAFLPTDCRRNTRGKVSQNSVVQTSIHHSDHRHYISDSVRSLRQKHEILRDSLVDDH